MSREKKCLVIGSSGGIGRAVVAHLKKQRFSTIGIDLAAPRTRNKPDEYIKLDLRDLLSVGQCCDDLMAKTSALWAIVYVAGVYPIVPFERYTLELWNEVHRVNVTAAFLITLRLADKLVKGGRIVLIGSGATHLGSRDVAYSASKAALQGLAKSLAINFANRPILVNVVSPGPVETAMSRRMPRMRVLDYKRRIPLRRFGRPKEIAQVVSFLLTSQSSYITGATIDINGGLYFR